MGAIEFELMSPDEEALPIEPDFFDIDLCFIVLCMPLLDVEELMLLPDMSPDELPIEPLEEPIWAEAPAASARVAAQASAILIIRSSPWWRTPRVIARVAPHQARLNPLELQHDGYAKLSAVQVSRDHCGCARSHERLFYGRALEPQLIMLLTRISRLFVIPEMSPALAMAHLTALKQQVPLLYLIISINSVVFAATHYSTAPTLLVVLPVIVLTAMSVGRGVFWWRLDLQVIPPSRYLLLLRRTNRLTAVLSPAILIWALLIERFDAVGTGFHILFFLALTSIGCIFCLTHLRSAAIIIALSVIGPTAGIALNAHEPELTSVAVNLILVGLVILRILAIQHRDFVALATQNEEVQALSEQNMLLASTDMLTSLPNRRTFFPALDRMMGECADKRCTFLLASIDLDGFKNVNDRFGHVTGDRVLTAVAERLAAALPPSALLARVGGDEFAIIIKEGHRAGLPVLLGDVVRTAIADPIRCGDTMVRVGASTGVARWKDGETPFDLIERADYAMYEAKAAGNNALVLFDDQHEGEMRLKGAIEIALRNADLEQELSLAFQPIFDVDRQQTVAFEALARWLNPALGRVPPDKFIIAAERIGMINEVTRVLLTKLLASMCEWPADVVISFNLSIGDIVSAEAIDAIVQQVIASGITPSRIHFEVTETAMLTDYARAGAGLDRLRAMGSFLSLDDFGTGHSSLSHVHRLSVDKLKVDGSFTREVVTHDTARNIVASIIGLAHGLKLECIVEGVETVEQMILLRGLGCRLMQGYLFHKPMAAEDVSDYLLAERVTLGASASAEDWEKPMITLRTA